MAAVDAARKTAFPAKEALGASTKGIKNSNINKTNKDYAQLYFSSGQQPYSERELSA